MRKTTNDLIKISGEIKEFVIVAEGQSNMVAGDGNIVSYDTEVNENVLIWNTSTNEWEILVPSDRAEGDSIYFHFARKYREVYGGVVKVILNAEGGKPIADWIQTGVTDRHQLLIDQLTASGVEKVDVHLWHQGEDDASNTDYLIDLKTRVDLVLSLDQYTNHEFTFLFGELIVTNSAYDDWRALALTYEDVIPWEDVAFVRSNDLISITTGAAVDVHFDGYDLYRFGLRYFRTYQNMSMGRNLVNPYVRLNANAIKTDGYLNMNSNLSLRFGTNGTGSNIYSNGTNTYFRLKGGDLLIQDADDTRFTFERTTGYFTATRIIKSGGDGTNILLDDGTTVLLSDITDLKVKVTLSSAQILALNTTPIEVVSAQGAGTVITIKSIVYKYNFVTTAYSTQSSLEAGYTGAGTIIQSVANILNETSDIIKGGASGSVVEMLENTGISIKTPTSDPTLGDATVDVYVTYEILTL